MAKRNWDVYWELARPGGPTTHGTYRVQAESESEALNEAKKRIEFNNSANIKKYGDYVSKMVPKPI